MPSDVMPTQTPAGSDRFEALCQAMLGTGDWRQGKMFGCPGLKNAAGKFFVTLWGGDLVFKLADAAHADALGLPGSRLFQPMPERPAMKQWVQVPVVDAATDERLARAAAAGLG